MSLTQMAATLDALAGGRLKDLVRDGTTLRFKIELPALAAKVHPDYTHFLAALTGCTRFELQPFRNESTLLKDLSSIQRMKLEIHSAEAAPPLVYLFGVGHGRERDARLMIVAEDLVVMDEAYDVWRAGELKTLRNSHAAED
jgi:hypothetical protein